VTVAPIATVCACGAEATGLLDVDSDDVAALGLEELPADEHPASRSDAVSAVAPHDIAPGHTRATRSMTSPDRVDPPSMAINEARR
jgi:hypothetical protein